MNGLIDRGYAGVGFYQLWGGGIELAELLRRYAGYAKKNHFEQFMQCIEVHAKCVMNRFAGDRGLYVSLN